jgi:ribonuclease VapC
MSTVNLTEVLGRLARDGRALDEALDHQQMGIVWIDFDRDSPLGAALLPGARLGLSPGDCACLALARVRNLTAVTADRAWAKLDLGSVEVVR